MRLRGRETLLLVTSLLLAMLIWFFTNLSKEYLDVISIPVVAECNIQGHSGISSNTANVSARCKADGFRLLREHSAKTRRPVRVNFSRGDVHHAGGDRYYIAGNAKNSYAESIFGSGVTLESFVSDTLFFTFPSENNKVVPIRLVPDSVTVYGEKSRLDLIDHVSTVPISLSDVHENRHGALRLRGIKGVRTSDGEVSYELPVARYVELRSVMPVPVLHAPAGHKLQVFPSHATVIIRCEFPVGRDPFESFRLYVDYDDYISSLTGRCVPRVGKLPPGVLDYRIEPEVFDCFETD